ncbi:unnamed protein product [Moneuplotes crassus]|uniref:Uncharacterized protein n=1 Tax=Euplotes crassus TaxID=5936 RepID=A0AAD1XAI6_EUPCR|nr:unnamed protein product [Moneuplotes crassus]
MSQVMERVRKNRREKFESSESKWSNEEFFEDFEEDIFILNLNNDTSQIKRRISMFLEEESLKEQDHSISSEPSSDQPKISSLQEFPLNSESAQQSQALITPKIPKANFRRRRTRRKCIAMDGFEGCMEVKKGEGGQEFGGKQGILKVEKGEEEVKVGVGHFLEEYFEPIMEMPSFEECGSCSVILPHGRLLGYEDAVNYELKELSSTTELINRIPYEFMKNTSKALKYKLQTPKRKGQSALKIRTFNLAMALIVLKKSH